METMAEVQAVGIAELKVENVFKVYSGKPGCGCGCRGKYYVNPAHREFADKERGYAYDDDEVTITQVQRILHEMQAAELAAPGSVEVNEKAAHGTDGTITIYSWETEKRYRWLYVRN